MTDDEDRDGAFESLLDYLKATRGFDFRGYKRATLERRLLKRMQTVSIAAFADYQDYLEVHPEEFVQLFNTILINVTDFFRDLPAWEFLRNEIVPQIVAGKDSSDFIRVWSAGCAAGQEAYSLAMAFCEAMGRDMYRERVKIYATDADEDALAQARRALYAAREVQSVPVELRDTYFEKAGDHFAFRNDLRRSVIFGRHDLVQDAPISRVDLLVCRNTLMYFNSETQGRILTRLHFALNENGFLFLGRAETLFAHDKLFAPVNLKHRLFSKISGVPIRDRLLVMAQTADADAVNHLARPIRVRDAAFEVSPIAQIVVDANGVVVLANERAHALLGVGVRELGRPLKDLEVSYRPIELRSLIDQAYLERRTIVVADVQRAGPGGEAQYLDVHVIPLLHNAGAVLGTSIAFFDTTRSHRLQEELMRSHQDLETSYEELQAANEELETTNEELQSSNEELETTNEELQSSNEELETMNEELQSSNEELQTVNLELRERTDEFNQSNTWLQSVLGILPAGLAVVDRDFAVRLWNKGAEELWGLRADEVQGRSFLSLDIGLPVAQLKAPILACLDRAVTQRAVILDAVTRRGKAVKCRVTCSLFLNPAGEDAEVAMMMDVLQDAPL